MLQILVGFVLGYCTQAQISQYGSWSVLTLAIALVAALELQIGR
jgi:hypothetical protein